MEGEVAVQLIELLRPNPVMLSVAVVADLVVGDPVYPFHPIRMIGTLLTGLESMLRRIGADGYSGGIALFVLLTAVSIAVVVAVLAGASRLSLVLGWLVHAFFVYSFLALGDLIRHVRRMRRVYRARRDARSGGNFARFR